MVKQMSMRDKIDLHSKRFLETPNRVDALFHSHGRFALTRSGVSSISLPTLILSSETQRGGIHRQPLRQEHIEPRPPLFGMPLMPERDTQKRCVAM